MRTAQFGVLALMLAAPRHLAAKGPEAPASAGARASRSSTTHVVRRGQTLLGIALDYKVSLERLCRANDLIASEPIRAGKKLLIPVDDDGKPDADKAKPEPKRKPSKPSRQGKPSAEPKAKAAKKAAADEQPKAKSATKPGTKAKRKKEPAAAAKATKPAEDAKPTDPYARRPKRPGYLILHSTVGRWEGVAVAADGSIPNSARKGFSRVMASWRTGERQAMSDDLLRLLVRVSDHFGGRPLRVVSGFRPWSKAQYTPHSQHNLGRAVDFSIPGVPNEVVRDYCRRFQTAGVGYYPNSSFVHLDARGYPSYWIDYSGPGKPPRYASGPDDSAGGGSKMTHPKRPISGS